MKGDTFSHYWNVAGVFTRDSDYLMPKGGGVRLIFNIVHKSRFFTYHTTKHLHSATCLKPCQVDLNP